MASNQTTYYQLSQWLPEDAVLRTDFNGDNAKIDAALAAGERRLNAALETMTTLATKQALEALKTELSKRDCWILLAQQVTTQTDASINMDVSGIDFTAYREVQVFFESKPCAHVLVHVNGDTDQSYYAYSIGAGGSGGGYKSRCIGRFSSASPSLPVAGKMTSMPPIKGVAPGFYNDSLAIDGSSHSRFVSCWTKGSWEGLKSMQFTCEQSIPAGAKITLYGLR